MLLLEEILHAFMNLYSEERSGDFKIAFEVRASVYARIETFVEWAIQYSLIFNEETQMWITSGRAGTEIFAPL